MNKSRFFSLRRIAVAMLLALALGGLTPTAQAQQLKPFKVGLSVADVAHLLLYVSEAKGLFKAEGLDTQLVLFTSDAASAQGLTAGAVQVNSGSMVAVLNSFATNRDLTTFWSTTNLPGYIWFGSAKYNSIKDLKGKGKVGISSIASLSHRVSAWAIKEAGLDPDKDIQFVAVGGPLERVAALKAGQVDVIPATPPGIFILEQDGFKPLLKLEEVLPEFVYETFYARKETIEKEGDAIKALIRAITKAKRWALENRDETTEILMKKLGADASQKGIYRKTVDWALPYFPDDGHFATKSVDVFLQFYRDQGRIKEIPQHSAFTDYRFIEFFKANPIR